MSSLQKYLFISYTHFLIGLFVFMILSCISYLSILLTNPLQVTLCENICSHSVICLFILFTVSFAVQKLLSLIRSHLFIFVFISMTLRGRLKMILLGFMSESVLPMFLSEFYGVWSYI